MVKRILAGVGGDVKAGGPLAWSASIAKERGASVTTVPVVDITAWKQSLPTVISAGRAAKLLDTEPWTQPEDAQEALRKFCCQTLSSEGIRCNNLPLSEDPLGTLASASRYHDLLLFGLGQCYHQRLVPDFTKAVSRLITYGACPLLLVPREVREVKKVFLAYSGTVASARSFRRFIQGKLFADAEIDLVCLGESLDEAGAVLNAAKEYLEEHGRSVRLTALRGKESVLVEHAFMSNADLIIAGSNHRNMLGIEVSSSTLRAFLSQDKIPVFISH